MKLHMSKDWAMKKFADQDYEEPGGVMACSPFIYSMMQTSVYADMNDVVKYIMELSLVEYTRDREHLGESDDRFIWMMERARRHAKRVIKNIRADDPNYTTENQ